VTALAAAGWALAAATLMTLRRLRGRLELVAEAEHELRGPLTAMTLAVEAGAGREAVESELARARTALADLRAARSGRRAAGTAQTLALEGVVAGSGAGWEAAAHRAGGGVELDWRAGPVSVRADRGRLAQAFGNLIANAVEHGDAQVELRGVRSGRAVRVEVLDGGPGIGRVRPRRRDRGRGLGIATRAVEEAGGSLTMLPSGRGRGVAVELPVAER
jgi:signal transduction histidine kinase